MTPTKSRAIDGIMDLLNSGSAIPRRAQNTFDQETKACIECGHDFTGSYKQTVCSDRCRRDRANSQIRKIQRTKADRVRKAKTKGAQ